MCIGAEAFSETQGFRIILFFAPISLICQIISIILDYWSFDYRDGKWHNSGLWSGCLGEFCFEKGDWVPDYVQAVRAFMFLGLLGNLATIILLIILMTCLKSMTPFMKKLIMGITTGAATACTLVALAIYAAKKEDGRFIDYRIGIGFALAIVSTFFSFLNFGLVFYIDPPIKEKNQPENFDYPQVADPKTWQKAEKMESEKAPAYQEQVSWQAPQLPYKSGVKGPQQWQNNEDVQNSSMV